MQHLVRATSGFLRQRYMGMMLGLMSYALHRMCFWPQPHTINITLTLTHAHPSTHQNRVAATAAVYFQRFYLRNEFSEWDPRQVAPACVYLASKTEESPLQAKILVQYVKSLNST